MIDLPNRKLLGKVKTPRPLAGIAMSADGRTVEPHSADDAFACRVDQVPNPRAGPPSARVPSTA
jgi:hypothetical protein